MDFFEAQARAKRRTTAEVQLGRSSGDSRAGWKYRATQSWPACKVALLTFATIAFFTLLFLSGEVALSLRKEPELIISSQQFQTAVKAKFLSVISVVTLPNPGGRPPKKKHWRADDGGGFFTFRVEGYLANLPGDIAMQEDFRVWFKFDSTGKLVVTQVESGHFI